MSDERTDAAIDGVLAVAASNFPGEADITISAIGKNTASIKIPYYVLAGIMKLARDAKAALASQQSTQQEK